MISAAKADLPSACTGKALGCVPEIKGDIPPIHSVSQLQGPKKEGERGHVLKEWFWDKQITDSLWRLAEEGGLFINSSC